MFQRNFRVEMRDTKKELDEVITELETEMKKLYNKMLHKLLDLLDHLSVDAHAHVSIPPRTLFATLVFWFDLLTLSKPDFDY